jgi:hypothetical protein
VPKHGITLVELHCSEFRCKSSKRLLRLANEDEAVIHRRLARWAIAC